LLIIYFYLCQPKHLKHQNCYDEYPNKTFRPHSGGKSTVAKLTAIFKSGQFNVIDNPLGRFKKLLINYNIEYNIGNNTYISYEDNDYHYEITKDNFVAKTKSSNGTHLNPIYIPAERVFFSTLSQSVFGLINSDIVLPKWIIDLVPNLKLHETPSNQPDTIGSGAC
jgi:hypothetical protein